MCNDFVIVDLVHYITHLHCPSVQVKGECADKEEAPIIVSNHVSPFEPFYLVSKTQATPVQRVEDSRAPILGTIQKAMQVRGRYGTVRDGTGRYGTVRDGTGWDATQICTVHISMGVVQVSLPFAMRADVVHDDSSRQIAYRRFLFPFCSLPVCVLGGGGAPTGEALGCVC